MNGDHNSIQQRVADAPSCPSRETATTLVENLAKLATASSNARMLSSASGDHGSNAVGATAQPATAPVPQHHEETVFSTIGLGILPNFSRQAPTALNGGAVDRTTAADDGADRNNGEDATEAACKAIQDAMERGVLAFASSQQQRDQQNPRPQLSIRIGVPMKLSRPQELMQVNQFKIMAQLDSLQQGGVELQQVETVAGGLWAEQHKSQTEPNDCRGILSVVACLSIVKLRRSPTPLPQERQGQPQGMVIESASSTADRCSGSSPTSVAVPAAAHYPHRHQHQESAVARANLGPNYPQAMAMDAVPAPSSRPILPAHLTSATVPGNVAASPYGISSEQRAVDDGEHASSVVAAKPPPTFPHEFHRSSSMDVLAHVSAEIRDRQPPPPQPSLAAEAFASATKSSSASLAEQAAKISREDPTNPAYGDKYGNNTNYKKLPPGKTPKNNKRLFVKHSYRDYSSDQPTQDEQALLSDRTPNAAFPLRLHETLLEIEQDGHDDIIGWLAHGRSFKIHKQQEFVEQILPKYFVMTKKSSFLRQLNLYGFNRLSGVGPDQGSYYHELFLRGMKFLCRRMQRCKVNGNRIRAAGNPDEEPVLSGFPSCPPVASSTPPPPVTHTPAVAPAPTGIGSGNAGAAAVQQHLATAAVLQLMASQRAPPVPSPQPGLSSLFGLVPGSAATRALLAASPHGAPTAADVATVTSLLASRNADHQLSSAVSLNSSLNSPTGSMMEGQVPRAQKQDRSSSMSSSSSSGTTNNNKNSTQDNAAANGSVVSFPLKLQRILDKLEAEGHAAVLSWLPHGRAFMVHNSDRLVHELMPLYFNQTKYSSFQRQLHMYNFQRITTGRDKGAYHHPQFLRGQPLLCQKMARTRVNGKGTRQPGNPQTEPDFYQLAPVPRIPSGVNIEIPQQFIYQSNNSNTSPSTSPVHHGFSTQQRETSTSRSAKPVLLSAPSVSSSSAAMDSEEES
uniref:HSF-type DNA-binding domain-containing protein n=1 Tax=Entomoneis paludosa TaxID=265537 RepID=A0A7S2Y922_9STRA|mmetsp:Transcript_23141/g.48196  ORF Transcript_23141/g.48196 Transcript_23141/m.48196 type:complete len:963 (+) Transcript_23141:301-3189(+)|eukprot:CAMPEP_0172449452 /NCGR_PEP_ID=MMETSP1065-20121228/8163_1 /TAXON_ID=265537 /ORGANISM="Amphiprora paludosa, Strain CCMP125" /LENGTH=962 /DNA_ID=CAMNT_0013201131 /DNA_START=281 /DNA_END=3169 /DNA_ORIENTATION=-